jgi:hypothetical protein
MVLGERKPGDFHQILEYKGFSHYTCRLHINDLAERGLITDDKMPVNGVGDPDPHVSRLEGLAQPLLQAPSRWSLSLLKG